MTPDLAALVERAKLELSEWDHDIASAPNPSTVHSLITAIESLAAENARLLADPMNVGWQHAESARKDRAAAVSQWKAEKARAERAEAERDALRDRLFALGAMEDPPCFVCGYNGPNYFQPDTHPCAAKHHAAIDAALANPAAPRP